MTDVLNILIIEDEEAHVELIKRTFESFKEYEISFAGNITEGKKFISEKKFDLIISDWKLPDGEGIDLVQVVKEKGECPIILMTSFGNQQLAVESMKLGVIDYIVKSSETFSKLPYTISRALREWENITARKKAEDALRNSEMRYRTFVENIPDVIFQVDLKGNFIFLNQAGLNILKLTKEELIGSNIESLFPPDTVKTQLEAIGKVLQTKGIYELQIPITIDGITKEYFVVLIPFISIEGEIDSLIGVCHDISELKRTERALKLSESKFREQSELLFNILRHIPNYIFWKDANSIYRGCNENFAAWLGIENSSQIIGKTIFDFVDKDVALRITEEESLIMEKGVPALNIEEEHINNKGEKVISSRNLIPLRDAEGNKAGLMGMFDDITLRKNAENELRKLSRATEQSPALIMITDTNGIIEYVNPSFEKVTGYHLDEIKGKNPNILRSGYTDPNIYKELWETINSGQEWRGELQNKKKNGELYWESSSISGIKNEKGKITHFISVKEDITVRKNLEFELKSAVDQAEESSRLKSSLLSNMSHELRTPLNGILGLSQILIEELSDNSLSPFAKKFYLAGKRLMITLNSILDLSEIESNAAQLNFIDYDLGAHLNYLLTQYIYAAKDKGLSFDIDIREENTRALVDERMCNQVLINIVDNAVKYTEKGGIQIIVENEYIENEIFVKVSIIDTGIGISQANIPLIFEEFRQVSEGYNRSFEGSGLGLTLVKKMLKLMRGDIKVESKIGMGSKFIVYLPGILKNIEPEPVQSVALEDKIGLNRQPEILLVEDNAINKEVIICYIEHFCNVDGVNDAAAAIEKARSKQYDLVLMDINLGNGMDGIQATKEIKKFPGYSDIPFVALTGYAMSGDKERLLSEGLTHYLPKPFDKGELQHLVKSILNL